MKKNIFILLTLLSIISCSLEHNPSLPLVEYNSESESIIIIQTDTAAHDTATISIDGFKEDIYSVKDTLTLSVSKMLKSIDQIELAYQLATHNNSLSINVATNRTNDTVFTYNFQTKEITPINVASVISDNCIGLYDVNYKRNYRDKIRLWIFKNKISPDSLLIENMNSLMKQFNYSGHKEYAKVSGIPPILKTLKDSKYKFNINLPGKYFYLYASQSEKGIKDFIEKKIADGFKDAKTSTSEEFICNQSGKRGPNCLFMIGIDENWKYTIVPLGIVYIDNIAPKIYAKGLRRTRRIGNLAVNLGIDDYQYENDISFPNSIFIKDQDVLVKLPSPPSAIQSSVSISYGSFEGNDYFGYNIPFYINLSGDVKSLTIGAHQLDAKKVKSGECTRLLIKGLHTGDNSLSISATDNRGNKSTSSLSIPLTPIRNSYDDDDYDDLEDRISDLEGRLDDLE